VPSIEKVNANDRQVKQGDVVSYTRPPDRAFSSAQPDILLQGALQHAGAPLVPPLTALVAMHVRCAPPQIFCLPYRTAAAGVSSGTNTVSEHASDKGR